jgi:Fe-S cluster assembly protein SufD
MTVIDAPLALSLAGPPDSAAAGPAWLADLRQRGAASLTATGLPTTKWEDWQQTSLAELTRTAFAAPDPESPSAPDDLARFTIPDLDAFTLVFLDGRLIETLSAIANLPAGVTIAPLSEAMRTHEDLVRTHLAQYAKPDREPFVALNCANLREGAFIHVPRGVALDRPIHLLFVSSDSINPLATHPRVLVRLEENAVAHVIEHHVGLGDHVYLSNSVTEFVLADHAHGSHYFLERDSKRAFNVSTLVLHQGAHTDFTSHSVLLGGKLVRNNVNPILAGAGSHSLLSGLYLPDGERHIDNHMLVEHQAPQCQSRQYYAGVLRERGSGVFIGRIKVERTAQKTDAVQSSRNLLLSEQAHAHNRPQLEIFADDVKCTHGSSTGQLDEDSVFYLRSRGIGEEAARGMLVFAFANEALQRMTIPPVRRMLTRLLIEELRLGPAVGDPTDLMTIQ